MIHTKIFTTHYLSLSSKLGISIGSFQHGEKMLLSVQFGTLFSLNFTDVVTGIQVNTKLEHWHRGSNKGVQGAEILRVRFRGFTLLETEIFFE